MLHGKHFQNGSKTLVLVFQNAAKPLNDAIPKIFNKEITQNEVAAMHEQYTWIKFAQRVNSADYLFIKDHFSSVYGWYFIDAGKMIYEQLNAELANFIQTFEYQRVIAFGSSKGGTGALLYGIINPYVTDVFSLVPQIHVADFINNLCQAEKGLFFKGDTYFEEQVNQLFYQPKLYVNTLNRRFIFYTGLQDIQFSALINYRTFLKAQGFDSKLFLNSGNERHTRLVNQYTPFIFSVLEDLINEESHRLKSYTIPISEDTYILKE